MGPDMLNLAAAAVRLPVSGFEPAGGLQLATREKRLREAVPAALRSAGRSASIAARMMASRRPASMLMIHPRTGEVFANVRNCILLLLLSRARVTTHRAFVLLWGSDHTALSNDVHTHNIHLLQLHNDALNVMFGFEQPDLMDQANDKTFPGAPEASGTDLSQEYSAPIDFRTTKTGTVQTGQHQAGLQQTHQDSAQDRSPPKSSPDSSWAKQMAARPGPVPAAERQGSGIDASDVRLANLRLMECIATRSKYGSVIQRLRTQAYPGT